MAVSVLETETKYDAANAQALPRLESLPQVAETRVEEEEQLNAEYYDTADLRLLRAGITLRRRRGGPDAGWHLKLPAGEGSREEIRLPPGRAGRPVPRELTELVLARTRNAPLTQVATVNTRRQRISLLSRSGEPLAEVADDHVSAQRAGDLAAPQQWREVEVELTGGDRSLLEAADKLLRRNGLRRSGQSAKLARLLGDQLPQPPARPSPSAASPAWSVVVSYLADQTEALQSMDPLVRRSEPDSVHQMRVATRRLRSTLRSFGSVLRRVDTEHLAAELKWLGDVLGDARDAEVLAAHLQRHQDQTDVALLLGPLQARIQAHFAKSRATALKAVAEALNSERYVALLNELDAVIADPPVGPDGKRAAGTALPAAVRRSYRKTKRRLRQAGQAPAGQARDAALHRGRRAAKRTRYAAETAALAVGPDASRFARKVKKVQSILGSYQDSVIARQLERRLGIAAHQAGESAFSYGLFYGQDECEAARQVDRAAKAWRKASKARYRRWLRV